MVKFLKNQFKFILFYHDKKHLLDVETDTEHKIYDVKIFKLFVVWVAVFNKYIFF